MRFRLRFGIELVVRCGTILAALFVLRLFFPRGIGHQADTAVGLLDMGIASAFLFAVVGMGIAVWNYYCIRKENPITVGGLFRLMRFWCFLGGTGALFGADSGFLNF